MTTGSSTLQTLISHRQPMKYSIPKIHLPSPHNYSNLVSFTHTTLETPLLLPPITKEFEQHPCPWIFTLVCSARSHFHTLREKYRSNPSNSSYRERSNVAALNLANAYTHSIEN